MAEEEKKTQEPSLTIKACDMNETMQHDAIEVAKRAIANSKVEKEMAEHIKKEFDKLYGPNWHCVVGKSFGSYCTHESGNFIYFYLQNLAVLLFKSG
mmetsp:Transcript_13430/g.22921  ORF Transcript_13430/g.22921 Transcript_13430/m.22921 type:complete len:97 (-) Transcript_13430:349-639(-)